MNDFLLSSKAKSDLIKIAKYTQLTWGYLNGTTT